MDNKIAFNQILRVFLLVRVDKEAKAYCQSQRNILDPESNRASMNNLTKENSLVPGNRCIKTLTILSMELKTKLQRQTISAHAKGPCAH